MAFLGWVFLIFVFGAADRVYVLWGISYETLLNVFRVAIWVLPLGAFFLVRRLCRELQASERVELERERAEAEAAQVEAELQAQARPLVQYVITLSGTLEFTTRDGETFVLRPGEVLLAADTTGTGHRWRLIDDQPWRRLYVELPRAV